MFSFLKSNVIIDNSKKIQKQIPVIQEVPVEQEFTSIGQINLIRAVHDHAQSVIDILEDKLDELEKQKEQIQIEKEAHQKMLDIAVIYIQKMNNKRIN